MWYKAESNVRPLEVDTTSSKVYVYLRRNIEEVAREDGIFFVYEEQKIAKEDYSIYVNEKNSADIEYISMMVGVDLE